MKYMYQYLSITNLHLLLLLLLSVTVTSAFSSSSSSSRSSRSRERVIAPETSETKKQSVQSILDQVYGTQKSDQWEERRSQARASGEQTHPPPSLIHFSSSSASSSSKSFIPQQHELVYGELGLSALITILDAVGIEKGDVFMDIGSGDGMLVSAASLLYSDYLDASMGIELVPELHRRSLHFQNRLEDIVEQSLVLDANIGEEDPLKLCLCPRMSLDEGNIYEPTPHISNLLRQTTIAVCFATTWSRGIPGRKLTKLSHSLGNHGPSRLSPGARIVTIDGVLDHDDDDGFDYNGQFKLYCPDTAPYSVARLYTKL